MKSFEWFVAWRYLFNRQRKALVSAITLISMAGVAVGVAALIVVIGVMDGADELLFGKIADIYPHLRIQARSGGAHVPDAELMERLWSDPDVVFAEPVVHKLALMQSAAGVEAPKQGVQLIGMERIGPGELYDFSADAAEQGSDATELRPGEILIGSPLAWYLHAPVGSTIRVISSDPIKTALYPVMKVRKFRVKGYFRAGFYEFDANTAFVHPDDVRELFRVEDGGADYIHVKLRDKFQADAFKRSLALSASAWRVRTWGEENGDFFKALKLEKLALFVILMLIILVAAFNIIGTLILMVIEKTREVGILRAVGASQGMIARIFLLDGVLIGLMGTALGVGLGLAICAVIPMIKIDMPASVYNFDSLPVIVRPLTVSIIVVSSMLVCSLAAVFPARQAARLNPAEALRHD